MINMTSEKRLKLVIMGLCLLIIVVVLYGLWSCSGMLVESVPAMTEEHKTASVINKNDIKSHEQRIKEDGYDLDSPGIAEETVERVVPEEEREQELIFPELTKSGHSDLTKYKSRDAGYINSMQMFFEDLGYRTEGQPYTISRSENDSVIIIKAFDWTITGNRGAYSITAEKYESSRPLSKEVINKLKNMITGSKVIETKEGNWVWEIE